MTRTGQFEELKLILRLLFASRYSQCRNSKTINYEL